jgi:hypothetical protein
MGAYKDKLALSKIRFILGKPLIHVKCQYRHGNTRINFDHHERCTHVKVDEINLFRERF